jgi:hypothetical protein
MRFEYLLRKENLSLLAGKFWEIPQKESMATFTSRARARGGGGGGGRPPTSELEGNVEGTSHVTSFHGLSTQDTFENCTYLEYIIHVNFRYINRSVI